MGIAALVLGILGFLLAFACGIGGILAILAIVFGFLGLTKAKTMGGVGKGMSIAGLILGVVSILVSILFYLLIVVWANDVSNSVGNWGGKADSSNYDLKITECRLGSMDDPMMTVQIKNRTSGDKSYTVDYEFRDGQGRLVDSGTSFPIFVPANDTIVEEISSFSTTSALSVKCDVKQVNNWFN